MKKVIYMCLPAFGNQFKAEVMVYAQVLAKFQIWARQFDLTMKESLALLYARTPKDILHFESSEIAEQIAQKAYLKLPSQDGVIDL